MPLDVDIALERVLARSDDWSAWRALHLTGEQPGDPPSMPDQETTGAILGPNLKPSPGATGEAVCELLVAGLEHSTPLVQAVDALEKFRTPAGAWLDPPDALPSPGDSPASGRVWATASAMCALQAVGRDPGERAFILLRGEADVSGRFTGGAHPTFAAAGVFWMSEGPKTEMAEWALRWARENQEEWWTTREYVAALTYWGAAGIPLENLSVETFLDHLREDSPPQGWADDILTLRVLEVLGHYGA